MLNMLRLLLIAGKETAANLIGNGVLALLRNADEFQRLRDDPGLIPAAVEELMRWVWPRSFPIMGRLSREGHSSGGEAVS